MLDAVLDMTTLLMTAGLLLGVLMIVLVGIVVRTARARDRAESPDEPDSDYRSIL